MNNIPLKVEVEKIDDVAIIRLAANFYTSNTMAQNLKATLKALAKEKFIYIVINMKEVFSIDSEGLGTLSYGYKNCINSGGNFVICELNNRDVIDVIEIVNLDKIIPFYVSESEALNNVKQT